MVPYFRELGLDARWSDQRKQRFFTVTRKLHAAIAGSSHNISRITTSASTREKHLNTMAADLDMSRRFAPGPWSDPPD